MFVVLLCLVCMGRWKFRAEALLLVRYRVPPLHYGAVSLIFSTEAASSPSLTDNNWTEAEDGVLFEWLEGSQEIHTAFMHTYTNPLSNHTHHALSCEHENICERSTYGTLLAEGWGICRCLFEEPCWGCWHTDHDNRVSLLSFPLIRWLFDDWPARQRLQVQKQRRLVGSAGAGAVKGQSRCVRSETCFYIGLIWEGTLCDSAVCSCVVKTYLSH